MFSIAWDRLKCNTKNCSTIQVTFLDQQGIVRKVIRQYQDWIGVCTNNIAKFVSNLQKRFPGSTVSFVPLGQTKNILPYFEDRLVHGNLDYNSKTFYKIYTTIYHDDVFRLFKSYKIAYFENTDWLVRIYIDLCTKYNTFGFYYKWYNIHDSSPNLLDSFEMLPHKTDFPDWTIAAFDLETVPIVGNHVPIGHYSTDKIVMISAFKWNKRKGVEKRLFYLLPDKMKPISKFKYAYQSEKDMLFDFHLFIEDAQILTGYNINDFDFPCLFARLYWLKLENIQRFYNSQNIGIDLVTTFQKKIVLDLYPYFKNFSGYNLPSFKLDDVARIKLGGESKIPIKSTGIWCWYKCPCLPSHIYHSNDVSTCFHYLKPSCKLSEFGTFSMYLEYCLKDTELVYRLFEKEHLLSFLVERANFTSLNAVEALHLGNSRYLLELFKTYGTRLGFFFNVRHFTGIDSKFKFILGKNDSYQGALNYCVPEQIYKDVVVMDFASMYPSTLLSSNLCYGTCTIMTRDNWLKSAIAQQLICIPYREHSFKDFESGSVAQHFSYPCITDNDKYVIVINPHAKGFLPQITHHFIILRQYHQQQWKATKNIYHYNVQLGIKILINSLYGVMANKDSCLAYIPIAAIIVTLARYQLLGSYHFIKQKGFNVCYADTDSLMVHNWPYNNCNQVNEFLNLPHVELKYEQRMKWLLVLSKKRYVYETQNNQIVTKGFQKKINELVKFMSDYILENVCKVLFETNVNPNDGWILWTDVLLKAVYMCRDPQKYSIYRKIKSIDEYKSKSCASYRYLAKYPDRINEYVEYTYSRADVMSSEVLKFVTDAKDCQFVNYEQLFINQKKIFVTLLNITFWKLPDPLHPCNMVLNTIRWGIFNRIELQHYILTGKKIILLVVPGNKYPFCSNDHIIPTNKRGRKSKIQIKDI